MLLKKYMPILEWLPNYRAAWLRPDLIAGLTTVAVVIPKTMAYALIAGLPVEVGLYTALVPMMIYAVLGTSRQLSVSTTTVIAILTATELAAVAGNAGSAELVTVAMTLAFMVGALLFAASLLKMGFLANFISSPVLTGFKAGVGLIIIIDQLPKLFGFHIIKGSIFQNISSIAGHVPSSHVPTLILAAMLLVLLICIEKFLPKTPAPLIAVGLGAIAAAILGLKSMGVEFVATVPTGLPSFALPDFSLALTLLPAAAGIALMSFTESIAGGRTFKRHGENNPDPDRELSALGMAGIVGGFFSAMPVGGGMSQTAVNSNAGARTPLASLITAAVVLLTLLFLAPYMSLIPNAALAVVVVVVSAGMVKPAEFRAILRVHRAEFLWALTACIGVLVLGALQGILVAIGVSLLTLMYQSNHPPVYALGRDRETGLFRSLDLHPGGETVPGMMILRTEGRMTFASFPRTHDKFYELLEKHSPEVIIFDLSAVPDFEYTALSSLNEAEERLADRGIFIWLAAMNRAADETVRRSPLGQKLMAENRIFETLEEAVERFRAQKA